MLGTMYQTGQGVHKDDAQAFSWHKKSADQGDVDSGTQISYMYERGKGISKDLIMAYA